MYWILHITVEYFRSLSKKVRIEFKYMLSTQQSDLLEEAFSCSPGFFSSKTCATLVAPDHPPQPSASFSAQLEARINDKLRVISYNWAYIEYSSVKN